MGIVRKYAVRRKCAVTFDPKLLAPVRRTHCEALKLFYSQTVGISHLGHSGKAESQAEVPAAICKVLYCTQLL